MTTLNVPVQQKERAAIVDVLRGFALTGVLIANFTSYNDQQTPSAILKTISSPVDVALMHLNSVFVEWKFMTLFSILFGYGFGLILISLENKNINPVPFFLRRMFWLFILGCIHTLFWWGDVLHLYAMSGILLLLFRKASSHTIFTSSLLFMFILPVIVSFLFRDQPDYFTDTNLQVLYQQYKNGNLWDVFRMNMNLYYHAFIITGGDVHDIIETLGRFLFGYFLLRSKMFVLIENKKTFFLKVLLITAPVVVVYFMVRWLALSEKIDTDAIAWEPFIKLGIISTTCFYASAIVLLFISFGQLRIFKALQALGKMTLTNYILISAILIIILYGIGFGKLGELSMHVIWSFAAAWLLIEIIFSTQWLRAFRYGPTEWIWRQLTYQKKLPLRK